MVTQLKSRSNLNHDAIKIATWLKLKRNWNLKILQACHSEFWIRHLEEPRDRIKIVTQLKSRRNLNCYTIKIAKQLKSRRY